MPLHVGPLPEDVHIPACALGIALRIFQGPPGQCASSGLLEGDQIAKRIGIAELAEQPGLLRAPAGEEVVEGVAQERKVAVEVIVVVIGVLLEMPAITLAPAAIVTDEGAARQLLHTAIEAMQNGVRAACREFTAQRPERDTGVVSRLADNRADLLKDLAPLGGVHF